ncbi:transcription elongation factor [Actinoplanes sp. NPDC048967]|uniref:MOSC domain-containing protein n=1 Tax=Actinoplanes sp. NPDC048967 TaxID=3155269 RepID=UPI0033E6A099
MDVHQQETAPVGEQRSMRGTVASVSCNDVYSFSKPVRDEIVLIAGLGVAGDVHAGLTVRHRSRVAVDPDQPNLRQVHLIRAELHDEVNEAGYDVPAGGLGENVTTTGIDLLALPVGTVLRFGPAPAPGAELSLVADAALAPDSGAEGSPAGAALAPAVGAERSPADAALAPAVGAERSPADAALAPAVGAERSPADAALAPAVGAERSSAAETGVAGPPDGAAAVVAVAARATLDAPTAEAVAALAARIQAEQTADQTAGQPASPLTVPDPADQDNTPTAAEGTTDPRPAIVITGLRNPCQQINNYRPGLLKRVLGREPDGTLSRRAGVMAVVLRGGPVRPGAEIHVELPPGPHRPLDRV